LQVYFMLYVEGEQIAAFNVYNCLSVSDAFEKAYKEIEERFNLSGVIYGLRYEVVKKVIQ
jgi:hypothetical protein